jgi:RNA polymerase sigma-B factor
MSSGLSSAAPSADGAAPPTPTSNARSSLDVKVGRHGHETRLLIQGDVDLSTAAQFSAALAVGLAVGADRLVVDLRGVAFFDCGGLEALARAARQACRNRTRLHVVPGAVVGDLAALPGGGWAELPECVAVSEAEPRAVREGNALTIGIDEPRRGALVLRPDGDLDLATVDLLDDVLTAALADTGRPGSRSVVVDLDRVPFMSAAGVAVLCQGQLRAGADGGSFRLAGGSPVVRRILGVTGTSGVLEPYDSVAEALTAAIPRPRTAHGAAGGPRRGEDYARLAPLFTERVRLPADDSRHQTLRTELITRYLPVARNVARRHQYRGENLDDLEQVATIGLINAVDRFDPARGVDFLSFAIPTINGEVQRHYRDRTSTIRVPRPIKELQVRVYQAADEMSQKMGRAATPRELALHLGVSLETVIQALQAAYEARPSSLDETRHGDDGGSDATPVADTVGDVDPELDLVDNRESLTPLLDRLPERRRKIVLLRFYGNMTQTEIAKRTGLSQMHVSRLLGSTLAQLRRQLVEGT